MNKHIWKSIGAVLAGILVGAALSSVTDVVLHAARVFPPWDQPASNALLLLATAYRTVYSVAGSYITARLAPGRPMLHALVLGALGLVVCIVGAVATWNKGPAFGPHWYPVALIVLAIPQCWAGAKLYEMQLRSRAVA
jgi:drug/metabolite transporter (DMT)-like permease